MVAAVDMNGRMRRFDTAEAVLESARGIPCGEGCGIMSPLLKKEFQERINCLNTREFTRLVQKMGYHSPLSELAQRRCWGMLRPANIDQMKFFFHEVGGIEGVIDLGAGQGYNSNLLEKMGVPVVALEYAPVSWSHGKNVFYPKIKYMQTVQDIENIIRELAPTHAMFVAWAPQNQDGADQAMSPYVKLYRQCGGRALLVTGPKAMTGDRKLWPILKGEWLRCYLHSKHSTTQPVGYMLRADRIRYFRPREEAELVEQRMEPHINFKTVEGVVEIPHQLEILKTNLVCAFEHLQHHCEGADFNTGILLVRKVYKVYAELVIQVIQASPYRNGGGSPSSGWNRKIYNFSIKIYKNAGALEEGGLVQKGVPMPPPLLAIPEGDDGREEKMPDGEDERGYRVPPINLKTFQETYHHLNILEQELLFAFEDLSRLRTSTRLNENERELSVKKIYAEFIQSLGHLNCLAQEEVGLDLLDRALQDKMVLKQAQWNKKLYLFFRKKSNIHLPALPLASVLDQGFVPSGRSKGARRRAAELLRKGEELEWEV